jgi:hypothetical protein
MLTPVFASSIHQIARSELLRAPCVKRKIQQQVRIRGQGNDVPCLLKNRTEAPEKNPGHSIFDNFIVTSILAVGELKTGCTMPALLKQITDTLFFSLNCMPCH